MATVGVRESSKEISALAEFVQLDVQPTSSSTSSWCFLGVLVLLPHNKSKMHQMALQLVEGGFKRGFFPRSEPLKEGGGSNWIQRGGVKKWDESDFRKVARGQLRNLRLRLRELHGHRVGEPGCGWMGRLLGVAGRGVGVPLLVEEKVSNCPNFDAPEICEERPCLPYVFGFEVYLCCSQLCFSELHVFMSSKQQKPPPPPLPGPSHGYGPKFRTPSKHPNPH